MVTTLKPKLKALDTRRVETLFIPTENQKAAQQSISLTDAGRDGVNGRIRGRRGVALRAYWLSQNPLCVMCMAEGRVTAGEEVDHIQPLWAEGADDDTNKQTLCKPHHKEKNRFEWELRWRGGAGAKSRR